MTTIRNESPADHQAVRQLTTEAFAASEFGHNGEADIVDSLRQHCAQAMSLVACSNDEIIGHILLTPVVIRSSDKESVGMGLGPMSVATDRQEQGVGSSLIEEATRQLEESGCPFIVVLGHPSYYPRFGFRKASEQHVTHGFDGIPQEVFFYKALASSRDDKAIRGRAYYRDEFGPQHVTSN